MDTAESTVKHFVRPATAVELPAKHVLLHPLAPLTEFATTKQDDVFAKTDFLETIVLKLVAPLVQTEKFVLETAIA
jgi:hypothetical protein